jgi:glycine hydroxymethyltransferase
MDFALQKIIEKEVLRQKNTIELIASENFASNAVMELSGSVLTNKYAEGYPGKRYYNGCEFMDEAEELAINKLKTLYGCNFANVQPHSGANANTAVFQAFLNPGDTIMGMDLASGGHLSHGSPVNISGKLYNIISYGVNKNGWIDYQEIEDKARKYKPKMIIAGASAYPRKINWESISEICRKINALFMVDMAHYSGLIAGGVYPSPVLFADIITSTTHKTLRGPRGGIILWNNDAFTKKINSAIFPGTQGGPLMHIIAAKAQCFIEASRPEFKDYSQKVIQNAKAMAQTFRLRDVPIQTGGTDSHIILVNLNGFTKKSGRMVADELENNGITLNKNSIPNDPKNFMETSGLRIGTAAETTRNKTIEDFRKIAHTIVDIIEDKN